MRALTSGWTERHTSVAALVLLALAASFAGLIEGPPVTYLVAGGVALTAVLALGLELWSGMVIGLAVAAGVVFIRRATDQWTGEVFLSALAETSGIIAVGALAGEVGRRLRRGGHEAPAASPFDPAYGSLGLLGGDAAMARLAEEIRAGERRQRPVILLLLEVVVTDGSLSVTARSTALRSMARIIESRAGEHDVPFALADDRFGVVFTETSLGVVWDTVGRIVDSTSRATFTSGSEREARPLTDVLDVHAGIAQQSSARSTAEALLDDALASLSRSRAEEVGS